MDTAQSEQMRRISKESASLFTFDEQTKSTDLCRTLILMPASIRFTIPSGV